MGFAMAKHLLGKGFALLMLRLAEDLLRCGAWQRASARPAWHQDVLGALVACIGKYDYFLAMRSR